MAKLPFPVDQSMLPSASKFWKTYTAKCDWPGCKGTKVFDFHASMGLKIGDPLPRTEDPNFNVCHLCKREMMKVTSVPPAEPRPQSNGFWKVPSE